MQAVELARQLRAILDLELRVHKLLALWVEGDADAAIAAIAELLVRAHVHDDLDAWAALETIVRAAGGDLDYATRQRLYEAAVHTQPALARLFFAVAPMTVPSVVLGKQLAAERPLQPRERPRPLGERKSLARTNQRPMLLILCKDPHPAVVEILLDNPHVTEADVVRIAALRPAVPDALALVAFHPRWSLRAAVKRALAWNPATPLNVGVRVVTTLRTGDLRDVALAPSLPAALRGHAAELLAVLARASNATRVSDEMN